MLLLFWAFKIMLCGIQNDDDDDDDDNYMVFILSLMFCAETVVSLFARS